MMIFVDLASVDGNDYVKWPLLSMACARQGSRFAGAIFRGAYGTLPDPTVRREWERVKSYGWQAGAYLFLRSKQPVLDQVHAFADNVGTLTTADLVPCIDIEDTWPSAEAELAALHQAWSAMKDIYGVPPMIYDSGRVWTEDLHNLPAGEMLDSPQWVAKPWPQPVRTPARLSPDVFADGRNEPVVPKPWGPGNWWLHQYQGDAFPVEGFTGTVDLSRFHLMVQGEVSTRVTWVQRRCGWPQTGVFDAAMGAQVRAFQAAHGLATDEAIGPRTFAMICWTIPGSPRSWA
jgi:GH25 family lysozyme M1 (1,4-beta-N-acetylmuramidase)